MNTRQTSMLLAAAAMGISTVMPTPDQLMKRILRAERKPGNGQPRPKGKGKRAAAAKRRRNGK
jgi:hypothetical protein